MKEASALVMRSAKVVGLETSHGPGGCEETRVHDGGDAGSTKDR